MPDRTKVLSVHRLRRTARKLEREITASINGAAGTVSTTGGTLRFWTSTAGWIDYPLWTRGVRVEKAGWFQWAVVATEHRGR